MGNVKRGGQPKSLFDLMSDYDIDRTKYISQEFQDYAYRLAVFLDDLPHKSLYMRLAKTTPRPWLEQAKNFVTDAYQVKNKAKLFMWKLQEIKTNHLHSVSVTNNSAAPAAADYLHTRPGESRVAGHQSRRGLRKLAEKNFSNS